MTDKGQYSVDIGVGLVGGGPVFPQLIGEAVLAGRLTHVGILEQGVDNGDAALLFIASHGECQLKTGFQLSGKMFEAIVASYGKTKAEFERRANK